MKTVQDHIDLQMQANTLTMADILWQAMKVNGFKSRRELAAALDVSSTHINSLWHGRSFPSDTMASQIAKLAAMDEIGVILAAKIMQAEKEAKKSWLRLLKLHLQDAAKNLCFAFILAMAGVTQGYAVDGTGTMHNEFSGNIYYHTFGHTGV